VRASARTDNVEMKFLCLGYFDRKAMGELSQAETDALMG
jgi:hypothetical protein